MFGRNKKSEVKPVENQVEKEPTLLDKMKESKNQHGIALVGVYNDGKKSFYKQWQTTTMKYANDKDQFDSIGKYIYEVNESYSRECDYDTLNFEMGVALLFSGKDLDENQKLKDDAEPINGIVKYYSSKSACYLDGEEIKTIDWGNIKATDGFINYDLLVKSVEGNGLVFNGPKTFEEFKEHILIGEPFDITISASLKPKEKKEDTQYTKTK